MRTLIHIGPPDAPLAVFSDRIEFVGPIQPSGDDFAFQIGLNSGQSLTASTPQEADTVAMRTKLLEMIDLQHNCNLK